MQHYYINQYCDIISCLHTQSELECVVIANTKGRYKISVMFVEHVKSNFTECQCMEYKQLTAILQKLTDIKSIPI